MMPAIVFHTIMRPCLQLVPMDWRAMWLLAAVGWQESGFRDRVQIGGGPARGFWQFERVAVEDVCVRHNKDVERVMRMLEFRAGDDVVGRLYEVIGWHDVMACCLARLFLLGDPFGLPRVGNREVGWETYVRVWKPGKPRKETWGGACDFADDVILYS